MCVYVSLCNSMLTLFSCDVYLCDLYVFESGHRSAARSWQAKPSYQWEAAKEQGWTHLLQCCQRLVTQVSIRQSVN